MSLLFDSFIHDFLDRSQNVINSLFDLWGKTLTSNRKKTDFRTETQVINNTGNPCGLFAYEPKQTNARSSEAVSQSTYNELYHFNTRGNINLSAPTNTSQVN